MHSSHKVTVLYSCVLQIEWEPIERVNSVTYLGVATDHDLNWKMHIESLFKKLSSVCFVIFKCRPFFDVPTLNNLFCSFP